MLVLFHADCLFKVLQWWPFIGSKHYRYCYLYLVYFHSDGIALSQTKNWMHEVLWIQVPSTKCP